MPQKKQTECGSNEAFNSQLRSCVPIVQGPSAFINISSFSPLYTSTRFKNDTTPVTFTISVSNPYNQSYTIEWDINYNGIRDTIAGNVLTTSIFPISYSTQIGSNVITAKILDSNGTVVDSHNFELVIQELPRPNINTTSIFPSDFTPEVFPNNTGQRFSFTGRNNGAASLANYRVTWYLTQNSVEILSYREVDTFTDTTTNGSNVFYFGTAGVPRFDASVLGVGSYVLRAVMENPTAGEVVAEHQWNITVRDPDFGFVSSANTPLTSQDSIAFWGVNYNAYTFQNASGVNSRYCVTVSDPDGAYVNGSVSDPSNMDVVVRFYKNGLGTPLFEGKTDGSTSPMKSEVCFDEATAAEEANLFFNDGSSTVAHYKTLTARVFDEQTGREICGPGMPTCPVAYPISWNILVKPVDTGVTAAFQAAVPADNITYTSSGTSTRTATVTQNQAVTVKFIPNDGIVNYEGYDMTDDAFAPNFVYDIVIKRAGVTIATLPCKTAGQLFPFTTTPVQSCTFTWPAFHPTTNEHLDPGAYVATLRVTEPNPSPVPGSIGATSDALTINATVSEPTNAPRLNPAPSFLDTLNNPIATADEGQTVKFRVRVEEDEHDDYTLDIDYCGRDNDCLPTPVSTVGSDSRSFNDVLYADNQTLAFAIPEDVLGSDPTGTVYFKVTITDAPTDTTKARSTTTIVSLAVDNFNADPTFNPALVSPASGSTHEVFAGYTFTGQLNAAISDASTDADEQPATYQWFIGTANDLNDPSVWTAIDGATSSVLKYTPGSELTATRYIAVCYSDGFPRTTATAANEPDLDGDANQRCQSLWTITPRTNSLVMTNLASANGEVAIHHVPSENVAYVAYASNNVITVEKVQYQTNGLVSKPMAAVTFNALATGGADSVKNLSLTASDTSLYVAYLADANTPGTSYRAHIRRLNISNDLASQGGEKTATVFADSTGMKRKFGFLYTALPVAVDCNSAPSGTNCAYVAATRAMTFDGSAVDPLSGDKITINGQDIFFETTAARTVLQICSDCDANGQAQSFAAAINAHPSTLLQGLTATTSGAVVTIHGMEFGGTEVFASTQAMTTAGKILYNSDNDMWYWPVANADALGNQNQIQVLRGDDGDVSDGTMIKTNFLTTLGTVSAIDNAWSSDAPLDMYASYITLSGSLGRVTKLDVSSDNLVPGVTRPIVPAGAGLTEIQMAGPLGTANPNVFVSSKDSAGKYWISRLPSALGSQISYDMETLGADANDTTLLDIDNVSRVYVSPAAPAVSGGTTNEARVVVVSDNGLVPNNAYLFRMKTSGSSQVLDSTTTFDLFNEETSPNSKLAAFAPTTIQFGSGGAVTADRINNTMGVLRLRVDGEVEMNFLNTEVESINSTTNSNTGEFRAPYVK